MKIQIKDIKMLPAEAITDTVEQATLNELAPLIFELSRVKGPVKMAHAEVEFDVTTGCLSISRNDGQEWHRLYVWDGLTDDEILEDM